MKLIYTSVNLAAFILVWALVLPVSFLPPAAAKAGLPEQSPQTRAPRKKALIVGVSGYSRNRAAGQDWTELNTDIDVNSIEYVLSDPKGQFSFDEVRVLKTKDETTREKIIETFRSFLIDSTKEGDVVYFHYSGHGGQAPDKAGPGNLKVGDEIDGYDETLIPSNYVSRTNGSNDIRDDEIEELIAQLKSRKPSNITLTFDSCHSGTITRGGESKIRGGAAEQGPGYSFGENESPSGLLTRGKTEPQGNGLVLISAARHDQSAGESPAGGGVFSKALVQALGRADDKTTYRDLFEMVSDRVARNFPFQKPQIEGEIDQRLMSDIVRKIEPYIEVDVILNPKTKRNEVVLKAGSLMGITKGSQFSLYEVGRDPRKGRPLARGTVGTVGGLTSILKIAPVPGKVLLDKLRTARAFQTRRSFGDLRLRVLPYKITSRAILDQLRALKTTNLLNSVTDPSDYDVRLCEGACPDEAGATPKPADKFFTLQRRNGGSVIKRLTDAEVLAGQMASVLEGESRWALFNDLQAQQTSVIRFRVRLVPVEIARESDDHIVLETRDLSAEAQRSSGGQFIFKIKDLFRVEVMNLSNEDIYITLLDIVENGDVLPLFPSPDPEKNTGRSGENKFPPARDENGKPVWQKIPLPYIVEITPPSGNEVFRAFATTTEADFSPLFSTESIKGIRRGDTRGKKEAKMPLGKLFTSVTFNGQIRSRDGAVEAEAVDNVELSPDDWGIFSIPFEVKDN